MKTLIGVLLYRPGYKKVLEQLVKANPGLDADLVLTNDTGLELEINESLTRAWGSVTVFDQPANILQHVHAPGNGGKLEHIPFKRIAAWQNALLLYGLQKGYDTLIIWEDDQLCYFDSYVDFLVDSPGEEAFFAPQVEVLANEPDVDVCVSKRQGYLHRIPPFISRHFPADVLDVLEKSLCLCNEIVYTGLMTEPGGGFVPCNEESPYGGVEYFGDRPFIYAGSLAINLRSQFPCFYDVPDLPGYRFSRGNDTFFSLGFDSGMNAREAGNTYFHDPYMLSAQCGNPGDCFVRPMECGSVESFLNLIKGWFTYSCLLLRLAFPNEWKSRIKEIDSLLKQLPGEYRSIYDVFSGYAQRVPQDYTAREYTLDTWRAVCGEIRARAA